VAEFQQRFPFYKLEADSERSTVRFRVDETTT
jgi:hypothetical protein